MFRQLACRSPARIFPLAFPSLPLQDISDSAQAAGCDLVSFRLSPRNMAFGDSPPDSDGPLGVNVRYSLRNPVILKPCPLIEG